jgi:hypothetical protein
MIANEQGKESLNTQRMRELLLAHLQAAGAPPWPGADGVTLEEILHSYPQEAALGLVPDLETLVQDNPELADCLRAYFAG